MLRDVTVRLRLVLIATISYAAALGVLTWQALRGQSIVQPDAATLTVTAAIAVIAVAAALATLVRRQQGRRSAPVAA